LFRGIEKQPNLYIALLAASLRGAINLLATPRRPKRNDRLMEELTVRFPDRFQRPIFWTLSSVILVLLVSAYGAERPVLTLSADRSEYRPGETVDLTIKTQAAGPYDIYIRVTGPSGVLWADRGLQFQKAMAPAATNFVLADGTVKVPVSIARKELVQPGAYTFEAIVVPPGANPLAEPSVSAVHATIYVPALPGINFVAMHNPQSSRYRSDCGTCHLDKIRNTPRLGNSWVTRLRAAVD
jgi:hypothetical protein